MVRRPSRLLKVLEALFLVDVEVAATVRAGGCRHCGGALHAAHYARKPRGLPRCGPSWLRKRHSFCCAREGCRRRTTPPSTRFLGRRVWIAPWVVWVGLWSEVRAAGAERLRSRARLARRTWTRWRDFWRSDFPESSTGRELQARFVGPARLPRIWKELGDVAHPVSRWVTLLRLLSPSVG